MFRLRGKCASGWAAGVPLAALAAAASLFALQPAPAGAQDNFYKGKTINVIIGYRPGGSYGSYARLLVRHLGRYLPGKPTFVVRNMPGAGSLVAANYLYNIAPKDGTALGAIGQSVYLMQQLKQPKIEFDARKFTWIGRLTDVTVLIIAWHEAKAKTIEDVKRIETPIAVGGTLSGSTLYVSFLNELVGTRFKPIKGYSSNTAMLAMERGEIDATSSVSIESLATRAPTWVPEKKVNVLVQVALKTSPEFPKVPGIMSLVTSKADRTMMEAITAPNTIGRAIMAPPALPADRTALLRAAFDKAVASREMLNEAKKLRHSINPMAGAEMQAFIQGTQDIPPELVERMKKVVAIKYKSIKKKKKKKKKSG